MAKVTKIELWNPNQGLKRLIVVLDDDGNVIDGVHICQEPDEDSNDFYKAESSEEKRLKKKYPGMRIRESSCADVANMRWMFPELFGSREKTQEVKNGKMRQMRR